MISSSHTQDSEAALMASIHKLADAGGSVIQVRTREPLRAALVLRKHLIGSDAPYKEWDVVNGFRVFTTENFTEHRVAGKGEDFLEALTKPLADLRDPNSEVSAKQNKIHFFVYVDPHPFMQNNPVSTELLQQYAAILPSTNVCTILVTPDITLPDVPVGTVLITDLMTPSDGELKVILERTLKNAAADRETFPKGSEIDDEAIDQIAGMGLGLSLYEFETYAALAVIDAGAAREQAITTERMLSGLAKGKTAVVRQSEILELTHTEDIENVGGMGRLKDWIKARAGCYSEDARAFGVESPKGLVLVGVPGTGKSLVAKVVASVMGVPLVKLDFGRVFAKYVGDSESRVRQALKMVESMAPVALFVDEIDKGLGGAGGAGDSGVSSRVLGTYLNWLQECTAPVFSVVTANRIDGLPPELLRRGRFDQIFSVGLPAADERKEVLAIHLRKRGRDIKKFSAADLADFTVKSADYVPAEIESAVKEALIEAFNDNSCDDIEMRHILSAFAAMVPMSKSHKEAIDRIVAWAAQNAQSVSYPPKTPKIGTGPEDVRVIRTGARRSLR